MLPSANSPTGNADAVVALSNSLASAEEELQEASMATASLQQRIRSLDGDNAGLQAQVRTHQPGRPFFI